MTTKTATHTAKDRIRAAIDYAHERDAAFEKSHSGLGSMSQHADRVRSFLGADALLVQAAVKAGAVSFGAASEYHEPRFTIDNDALDRIHDQTLVNAAGDLRYADPSERWDTRMLSYENGIAIWQRIDTGEQFATNGRCEYGGGRKVVPMPAKAQGGAS